MPGGGGSYYIRCSTAKMALTLNTGLEYQILKRNNINLFVNLKLGLGKAFLIEEIEHPFIDPVQLPPCEQSDHLLSRTSLGLVVTYNLKH